MPKVYCAAIDCEFNGDDGKCHAKSIALSYGSIMTMWEGRQNVNRCKTWQKSQFARDMEEKLKPIYEKWRAEHETDQ